MTDPKWLTALFRLFSINYKATWNDSIADPTMANANKVMWQTCLKDIPEDVISEAGMKCITAYHYPPSIQQFLEIANTISRNRRMERSGERVIGHQSHTTAPPSPLLAEYMATHPLPPDDPFKLLYERYSGIELGEKVMALIKARLINKNISYRQFIKDLEEKECAPL